ANAPFSTLMKSSVKPALVGGVAAAALAAGLVAFAPEHGDNALMGAAVGGGMGALMFAGDGLSSIGQPVNGRVPSAIRVLAGPIMLGAGIGAAVGLGAGALMGLAGSSDSAERAGS
ncbi:MAG: hypothetical protein JWM86_341, partial [Thermoleophilia bacterium]|nr:hypothetical protein [Thermoleophilia bacterium]